MPVEAKPLFRPDVLRHHLAAFDPGLVATAQRPMLERWAMLLSSEKGDKQKEKELLPDFLSDYFLGLLGYRGPAGDGRQTLSRERYVEVDGKVADAVLGDFSAAPHYVVAVEGKGPRDPLDRPFAGRRMSAVDQGYRYAINLPCDWIIVTSIRQTRLYHKGSDQHTYERFDTEALADDEAQLRRFLFLLGADRVTPPDGPCHLYALLGESEKVGRELTRDYYLRYADMRQAAFEQLCRDNPTVDRHAVLAAVQKLLDRILFCAFCEDRGLLPPDTIRRAYEHRDPYRPRPIWENFSGLFGAVNTGNAALGIHAYNGGLFADDETLSRLTVSDEVCGHFRDLAAYDYRPAYLAQAAVAASPPAAVAAPSVAPASVGKAKRAPRAAAAPVPTERSLIDVDILGHIFEQSITDLERLRNELDGLEPPAGAEKHKTRRKKEGAFYTPAFITRYIVEQALGGVLRDRFNRLRLAHADETKGPAKETLADPRVYELDKLKKAERSALIGFWEAWQDGLGSVRLLDPACGSGAFLIEAFDQMHAAYQQSNDRLQELRGHRTLFDLDRQILENNLYGVDLNDEAIEICRLSLWIKTAERGKTLTSLDHTIRVGNSVVDDPAVHPRAFDWRKEFPEVFAKGAGGFDVVVGNPPYVRQELLTPIKPYLERAYQAYHGMADLYVYFYELGLRVLRPGGLLSFIVTNKWMKSGYGEPLRRFFTEHAWVESVVDFGHAKQIFEEADVFPSIIVARKPTTAPPPTTARLCAIPREQLRIDDLSRQIDEEGVQLPIAQLSVNGWQLEKPAIRQLLTKLQQNGKPLVDVIASSPLFGLKTGFNEAFHIDDATRRALVESDPACAHLLRPYVRGQDIGRWSLEWAGLWMIALRSSNDFQWPWHAAPDDTTAEKAFRHTYPSIYAFMKPFESRLKGRSDKGRFWWELRSCAYYSEFDRPKILIPRIAFHPRVALDRAGTYANDATIILKTSDTWIVACLNSPAMWYSSFRTFPHKKDEALAMDMPFVERMSIPDPTARIRASVEAATTRVCVITDSQHVTCRNILDWLRVEYDIEKPTLKLQAPTELDSDAFVAEVRKVRGKNNPLSAAALKALRDEHARTIEPARGLATEALQLEAEISDLVNAAYGLTPDEVALMWQTAPPRMPQVTPHVPARA